MIAALIAGSAALATQASAAAPMNFSPASETTALGPLAMRPRAGGPVALRIDAPAVRIGLAHDARRVTISSAGGWYLVDAKTGRDLWRRTHRGPIHIVLEYRDGQPSAKYRVQVGALKDPDAAEDLRRRVETESGEVATVTPDPERRNYRVRVGQAPTREAIRAVEEKIRAMGFLETWIVQESVAAGKRVRVRLVDEDYNDLVVEPRPMLALPAGGEPIEVEGRPYRGAVEVLVPDLARLQAVNVVNLEEYLRGVVPHELSPSYYPEIEAMKAQAIAARTYVVANKGQFSAEGYDICDTARCQVYKGTAEEDPLSDQAIEETRGLVLTYEGEPINALYTAACGGHTEDVENVFREERLPYLRGVACYPDEAVLAAWRRTLAGAPPPRPILAPSGERIEEALALLSVQGIVDPAWLTAEQMETVATHPEIAEATRRALGAAGKKTAEPPLPSGTYPTVADLARYLVAAFAWQERVARFLDPRDLPSLLGGAHLVGGASEGAKEAAYLIKEGILPARLAPGDDLLAPATRGLLFRALHRLLARYEATGLQSGIFRGSRGPSLILVPDADEAKGLAASREIDVAPGAFLSRDGPESRELVPELTFVPGDRISYHLGPRGADYVRLKANVKGASDDRFTTVYQWEVRTTRDELRDRIRERASIGELIDVIPNRRGVSGRVTDLTVVGSAGRFTFRGFSIRTLLGIRETLFVVDRQRDADGRVATFIFAGRGWGHGVGLCQVGAYGMALRGATHDEILRKYYTGVAIEPLTW